MSAPTLHAKQHISFGDTDFGIGLLDYGDGPMEDYDVVRCPEPGAAALQLSGLDLVMPRNWIHASYYFQNTHNHSDFMSPDRLKASLAKALQFVPALAGRLQSDDGTTGMNFLKPKAPGRILLNNKGAWFTSTSMKTPFSAMRSEYLNSAIIPSQFIFKRFIEAARESREKDVDAPLLAVKAVYFDCGSVVLTVYTNHQVTDGRGMYEFVRLWGQVTRGVTPDPLKDSRHVVLEIPKLDPVAAAQAQEGFAKQAPFQFSLADMHMCKLTIPVARLKKLKEEVNAKIAPEFVSTDDLFYGVHMRMLLRARQASGDFFYNRTVSIRHHLGLDDSAFGNFVNAPLEGPLDPRAFVEEPLERVVLKIRKNIVGYTQQRAMQLVKECISVETHTIPDQLNNYNCCRDIGCTSVVSYDPARIDFHGSPCFCLAACYYVVDTLTINNVLDGVFNGVVPIDLSTLEAYQNDPEAKALGFTVTPLKKLLFE